VTNIAFLPILTDRAAVLLHTPFADSSYTVKTEYYNTKMDDQYKYYYSDAGAVVDGMKAAAEGLA
jgi:hypothetical protein